MLYLEKILVCCRAVLWTRIHIDCGRLDPENRKKGKFYVFYCAACSLLRAEGLSCSLVVLHGGQRINKVQFFLSQNSISISFKIFQFLAIKTLGSGTGSALT